VTFLLYAIPLLLVLAASYRAATAARGWGAAPGIAGVVTGFALLELGSLVPGALGFYRPWPVAVGTAGVAILVGLLLPRAAAPADRENPATPARWPGWVALLAMLGLMECRTLVRHLFIAPSSLVRADYYLDYDVVYYHLPALADFLRHGTLWRTELPYQNYFYAHELIGGFAAVFFRSHWGFFPLHFLTLLLLVAVLARIMKHLLAADQPGMNPARIAAVLVALGLWLRVVNTDISRIGKNDHFVATLALAALALLLDYRARPERGTLLLGAAAAGLAVGTKPTALVFLPVWLLMATVPLRGWLGRLALFSGTVAVLGGFWLLRNAVLDGSAIPAGHADGFARTVWRNLGNPLLWQPTMEFSVFLLSMFAIPIAVYRGWRENRAGWKWISAFVIASAGGALFTPFLFFDLETGRGWQLRLVHAHLLGAAIIYGASIVSLVGALAAQPPWSRIRHPGRIATAAIMLVLLVLPFSWSGKSMAGASVWANSEHGGTVGAYAFARNLPAGSRIASWGAAPAWLLGDQWRNVVSAHYNSAHLTDSVASQHEVLRVLRDFLPEYVVVMAQPAYGPAIPRGLPPGTDWLRAQPWLREEYSDAFSAVFAVQPGWQDAVKAANLVSDTGPSLP
jgi:hypothetical protein